jgi:hypothetical protein
MGDTMSKKSDELERERSARKQSEIDAEVNANKEIVYNYIASRKDVLGMTCVTELKMFDKGKRYLEWLSLHGYLVRMKRTIDSKRQYVYNAIKPFVNPTADVVKAQPTEAEEIVRGATRVIRLLDREQAPMTKEDRERLRRSTKSVSIGSSMNMFGGW